MEPAGRESTTLSVPTKSTELPPASELAAISVSSKIPEFWKDMPRLWFAQFESIMDPQKQGDLAKFNMVVAKLTKDALQQVCDLILSPPADNKYDKIKARLITAYEDSAERQFHKLVSEMDLGSQRPSQLLRRMSELASNTQVSTDALRRLWISRLPGAVKAVLSVAQDTKLESLAEMADKIMENLHPHEVAVVAAAPTTNLAGQLMEMTLQLRELRQEISEIRGRSRERYSVNRNQSRSQSRSQSRGTRRTPESPNWLCRFHYRYRGRARTCEQPCNWKQPDTSGRSGNGKNQEN